MLKWDYKSNSYSYIEIPNDLKIRACTEHMNDIVNCANCYDEIKYGDGFTSKQYQTSEGFGYCVCKDCYTEECLSFNLYDNE